MVLALNFQNSLSTSRGLWVSTSTLCSKRVRWVLHCTHISVQLNHVIKTRERIVKNNTKLHKQTDPNADDAGQGEAGAETLPDDTAPRDQGFTRPKVGRVDDEFCFSLP